MEIHREAGLRAWLRDGWDDARWGPLVWVEAARGGTDGAADVFVPIGQGYVPLELKVWEYSTKGFCMGQMRPSQKRLHRLMGKKGLRSAILVATSKQEILVGVGLLIASFNRENQTRILLRNPVSSVEELYGKLNQEKFWKDR